MYIFLPHDCCHYIMSLSTSLIPFSRFSYNHSFFFSCPFILTFHITMTEPVYNHSKERIPSHVNQIDSLGLSNTSKIKHPCSLG